MLFIKYLAMILIDVGQSSRLLETRQGDHQDNIKYKDQYHNVISKNILDSELPCNSHSMN